MPCNDCSREENCPPCVEEYCSGDSDCRYQEAHKHGFACDKTCTICEGH